MPMSQSFQDRLFPIAEDIASHYGTPFHIYDEAGIRATGEELQKAFVTAVPLVQAAEATPANSAATWGV